MGILSANNLPCSFDIHTYDFSSDSSQVYGGLLGHKELSPGIWGMVSGDANANGFIDISDKNEWIINAGESQYTSGDFNFDGEIDNQDKTNWEENAGYVTQVPD